MILRDYQLRAVDELRDAYRRGRRSPLLVLPCGGGKTIVSANIMASGAGVGTHSLFVCDRSTLVDQTTAKVRLAGIEPRVIQADRDEGPRDSLVTIASAQTIRMPGWQDRLPEASLVIWDECHGVVARTYQSVIDRYPRARLLGLSATPCRGDNRPLSVFDELVVGATIAELTALGHLAPPRVLAPPEGAVGSDQIALDPVTAYRRHADGRRAAVFCSTVEQANQYAADFDAAGISALTVTASTPERAAILAAFADDQFRVLCSVGCLTQGWDDPGCGVAIVARKPAHIGLWLQICGRVLRPYPGKTEGLILDLCGAFWDHGPPDAEHTYSLTGKAISSVLKDSLTQCRQCGSGFLSGPRTCPYCGAEMPVRQRPLPKALGVGLTGAPARPKQEFVVAMTSTRRGLCHACGEPIATGDDILWATVARRARHHDCKRRAA